MKITILLLFILCAGAAFGQYAAAPGISSQATPAVFTEHPEHAMPHAMRAEVPIVGGSAGETYTYEHGEEPLWQFGPVSVPTPLGDVARAYRKQKLAARKAEFVLEKQGS
jgi:hypothetical protein